MLNRLSAIALSTALLSSGALAADLPRLKGPPLVPYVEPVPVFTWTGFYVGFSVGALGAKDTDRGAWTWSITPAPSANTTKIINQLLPPYQHRANSVGLLNGLQAGYNYQMGSIVLGLELSAAGVAATGGERSAPNFTNLGAAFNTPPGIPNNGLLPSACLINCAAQNFDSQWKGLAMAKLRAGYTLTDRWMLYITGGAALADIRDTNSTLFGVTSVDKWRGGWVIGTGTEFALTDHLTAGLELLYVGLGNRSQSTVVYSQPGSVNPFRPAANFTVHDNYKDNALILQAKLNYKF